MLSPVFLPGMGATSEMYGPLWRRIEGAEFVDWPQYRGERSLSEIADRVIEEHDLSNECLPAGSSLGGMVALEIAARLQCEAVLLIGSAVHRREVSPFLIKAAPFASMTPVRLVQLLASSSTDPVSAMFQGADPAFLRAMCGALASWNPPAFAGVVLRVHGSRDRVIPCPPEAAVISDGGHLIAVTHAAECLEALKKFSNYEFRAGAGDARFQVSANR
jgi:pimeloyl-ACP methyl ester carboxylesterase